MKNTGEFKLKRPGSILSRESGGGGVGWGKGAGQVEELPCTPGHRRLFPFRKQAMPFLTVDAIIGNQAFQNGLCYISPVPELYFLLAPYRS